MRLVSILLRWLRITAFAGAIFSHASQLGADEVPVSTRASLKQILIADGFEAAQNLSPVQDGEYLQISSSALSFLDKTELQQRLIGGRGNEMKDSLLVGIAQVVESYVRSLGRPAALVLIPPQDLSSGAVRVAVLLKPALIRQIIVGDGVDDALNLKTKPESGLIELSPSLSSLDKAELTKRLAAGENQLIHERVLAAIAQVIEVFAQQHDLVAAKAIIPPQDTSNGVVRVALLRGKVRNIKFAGNRWFSESLLREKLRIERGESLRLSDLDTAISWANNSSPFRRLQVIVNPVGNNGEADLLVAVQETLPLRLSLSVDNGGNAIVGNYHFVAAVTYANLWGRDHQVSYQFITTDLGPQIYQGHGLDYRAPLRWHDYLQFSASYLKLSADLFAGILHNDGENITANLRYTRPVRTGDSPAEVYAGIEFKESNNVLAFYDTPVPLNKTDIFQFAAGGSMIRRDKLGTWVFGASANLSPGRFNSRNSGNAFFESRALAKPYYAYGQLTVQRVLNLTKGWDFTSRNIVQIADGNLLGSEQFYIGGASSVRGFRENIFGGDEGFLCSNELLAPVWRRTLTALPKNRNVLETRLLAFYDAGQVREKHPTYLDPKFSPLTSTGIGLRMNIATNFSLSADYGWQITHLPYAHDDHGRGHVKVTLAY